MVFLTTEFMKESFLHTIENLCVTIMIMRKNHQFQTRAEIFLAWHAARHASRSVRESPSIKSLKSLRHAHKILEFATSSPWNPHRIFSVRIFDDIEFSPSEYSDDPEFSDMLEYSDCLEEFASLRFFLLKSNSNSKKIIVYRLQSDIFG